NGYDVIDTETIDGRLTVSAARADGEVIDVYAYAGSYSLEISMRDISFDLQEAAEVVESAGTATVVVGDATHSLEGNCTIQGADYRFEHQAADGTTVASVEIYGVSDPPSGSAFFMEFAENEITQYVINFPMYNDNEPIVTSGGTNFGVSGELLSTIGAENAQGSFSVACAR
ncbi:MAG: hypothetical protein ACYSWX_15470, partial [Planctomycetota bacterium]